VYLKKDEREAALSLSRSLKIAKEMYDGGERTVAAILAKVRKYIEEHPHTSIDYAKICDTTTLKDVGHIDGESVLALAVKINKTRLIDNYVFGNRLDV
jgi:pantoate--beta-alanine ligase